MRHGSKTECVSEGSGSAYRHQLQVHLPLTIFGTLSEWRNESRQRKLSKLLELDISGHKSAHSKPALDPGENIHRLCGLDPYVPECVSDEGPRASEEDPKADLEDPLGDLADLPDNIDSLDGA